MSLVETFDISTISPRMQDFYQAVHDNCDDLAREAGDEDFYYDQYIPSFRILHEYAESRAEKIWDSVRSEDDRELSPEKVEQAIKRGLRVGYAWAQAELNNG